MKRKKHCNKVYIYSDYQLSELKNKTEITHVEISIPNVIIGIKKIPNSVIDLKFNYNFKNLPSEIPTNIKSIYFYEYYNLLEELPNKLENIIIHKGFNHPVDKLHDGLKLIDFGLDFNQPIDNLPSTLEKIVLGIKFNYSINNLPQNIKFITILNIDYDILSIMKLPKSIILLELGTVSDFDFKFGFKTSKYISIFENNQDDLREMVFYKKKIYFYKNE